MTFDPLKSPEALGRELAKAGSWVKLSDQSGIPVTTLKSRGQRLGVTLDDALGERARIEACLQEEIDEEEGMKLL